MFAVSPTLKHRVLFGSDNPVILPDRWLAEFDKLPIKPDAKPSSSRKTQRGC